MSNEFHHGDKVTWQSHGETVHGTVERAVTEDTELAGRTVRASRDEPQYLVTSDANGSTAVHKPEALTRAR